MARKYYPWPYRWISGEPGITFTIPPGYRSSRARSTLFYKPYLGLMTRERDTAARIDSIHKRFVKARYLFHWRTTVIPLPYFCVRDNIEFSPPPPLLLFFNSFRSFLLALSSHLCIRDPEGIARDRKKETDCWKKDEKYRPVNINGRFNRRNFY